MKTLRFIITVIFILFVLMAGFVGWLISGSFAYQSSQKQEFQINAPLSEVCRHALTIKEMPRAEEGEAQTKIDVEKAFKSFAIGEPIDCEVDHPKLGKLALQIKLNLQMDGASVRLNGETISIEPKEIRKMGIPVAELEKIQFSLGIEAKKGSESWTFFVLPTTGQTVIHFASSTDMKVRFRDMKLIRSVVDSITTEAQKKMIAKIEDFIGTNFSESEIARSREEKEKEKEAEDDVKKPRLFDKIFKGGFSGRGVDEIGSEKEVDEFGDVRKETYDESVNPLTQEVPGVLPDEGGMIQEAEEVEETEKVEMNSEEIDISVLDEEL
ncbi:MAG: hypothetical protein Q4C70_06250 [Planctomycetia bacterium]|nr:hypothetical protein [Planctomycetia bacterium]